MCVGSIGTKIRVQFRIFLFASSISKHEQIPIFEVKRGDFDADFDIVIFFERSPMEGDWCCWCDVRGASAGVAYGFSVLLCPCWQVGLLSLCPRVLYISING